jgi:NADH-quinone oxidoreductase subunit C
MSEQEKTEGEAPAEEPKAEAPDAEAPPAEAKPARAEKAAAAPAKEPPPPGGIADLLKEALPDVQMEAYQGLSSVIVEIGRDDVAKVAQTAREDPRLDLKFLRVLFGVDHEAEGFEVVYQLLSLEKGHEVTLKTRLPQDDPKVASVASVWNAANWHERETRDMFGIDFQGHPHLVPLLLPEDMTDHFPLRKDNPLAPLEEWQGVQLGDEVANAGHIPEGSGFDVEASAEEE